MGVFRNRPAVGLGDNPLGGGPGRASWYGDAYVVPLGAGTWPLADEGSYYTASNAALETAITGHAAPVVADGATKPLVHIFNGGQRHIVLDFLFLEVTTAGTGGTVHHTTIYLDNNGSSSRTSGGTAVTPVSTRSDSPSTSGATIYVGAVVAAPADAKKVGQQLVREVIPVARDTVMMMFGGSPASFHSSLTTAGTATNHSVQYFPPLVIAPGGNVGIAQIRASQTVAATYQFQLGYFER